MTANELSTIMKDSKLDLMGLEETEETNGGCLLEALEDILFFTYKLLPPKLPPTRTTGLVAPDYY